MQHTYIEEKKKKEIQEPSYIATGSRHRKGKEKGKEKKTKTFLTNILSRASKQNKKWRKKHTQEKSRALHRVIVIIDIAR